MKKIKDSKFLKSLIARSNRTILPGFHGVPIGNVMSFFAHSLAKGIIFHRAAAMTYRVFFSLIPLLMTLFAAISFLGKGIRELLLDFIQSVVPDYVWPAISDMINEIINHQNGTLLSFSLIFSLLTVLTALNACINILNTTYFSSGKRKLTQQLKAIGMLLLIWFGIILLAIGVFIGAAAYIRHLDNYMVHSPQMMIAAIHIVKWLVIFALVYLFISVFYYLAPVKRKHYSFFSAGSTFATLALVLVLLVMNFYFANFGNYNVLYGSLGAVFAILLWVYWNSLFILVGYDLNVSIAKAKQVSLQKSQRTDAK